jgi:Tfp pilus assembly protein PilF
MSSFIRALQLRELHRYEEAVAMLSQHLAQFPEDAEAHAQLAITRMEMPGERRRAIEAIDAAIGLEADNAGYFGIKSLILSQRDRHRDALAAAETAIATDPALELGWIAKADALSGTGKWAEAQEAAETALKLDPDNESAQHQLAMILRMQGNLDEADRGTAQRLERDPEDPMAQTNAGWSALQRRDIKKAEEHFREALRIDPELEYARIGLREAYKARSLFYRLYLRWVFFLQRFSQGQKIVLIVGIYLGFKFGRILLAQVHPVAAAVLVVLYLFLVFGTWMASGIGHFLLLKDRTARLTLSRNEKLDGLFVGGGFLGGIVLLVLGMTGLLPLGVAFLGGALMAGAVPASMVFENESKPGRLVFGAIMAFIYFVGVACLVQGIATGDPLSGLGGSLIGIGLLAAFGSTWLGMVPALRRGAEE